MWLNKLFADSEVDFAARCRTRMKIGIAVVILGAVTMGMVALWGGEIPTLYLEEARSGEFVGEYYTTLGVALMAAGGAMVLKNLRWLKHPELMRKREVAETDERNQLLGLRCWAYTGYAMFFVLYLGILAGGFISVTVMVVLQVVLVVYVLMLLLFRVLLSRCM